MRSAVSIALAFALSGCRFELTGFDVARDAARSDGGARDAAAAPDLAGADLFGADLTAPADLAGPADLLLPADLTLIPGELIVARAAQVDTDLTVEGVTDWASWGLNFPTDLDRKATGGSLIAASAMGGLPLRYQPYPNRFSWIDGTPIVTATNTAGIYIQGQGHGFSITAPAGVVEQVLHLYLCDYQGTGALSATLADGSAGAMTGNGDGNACYQFRITYRSSSASQLAVTWILNQDQGGGSVSLEAATLLP